EYIELESRRLHRLAVAPHLASAGVDRYAVDFEYSARVALLEPPHDGADPCDKFAGIEWLGQIIVGTQFEAHDAVFVLAARRKHQDGQPRLTAHTLQNFETIEAGQHDVKHHQVIAAVQGRCQTAAAIVL